MKNIIKADGLYKDGEKVIPDDFLSLLRYSFEIEQGVTLKNIFDIVKQCPVLIGFISFYSECNANLFIAEMYKEPPEEDKDEPLNRLEISWIADHDKWKDEPNEVDFSVDFHAFGPITDYHRNDHHYTPADDKEEICYGVGFLSVSGLGNLPITLNTKLEIFEPLTKDNLKPKLLFAATRPFSLLDILDSIFYEISFYGSPEKRDETRSELLNMVEDIKSGKATTEEFPLVEQQ